MYVCIFSVCGENNNSYCKIVCLSVSILLSQWSPFSFKMRFTPVQYNISYCVVLCSVYLVWWLGLTWLGKVESHGLAGRLPCAFLSLSLSLNCIQKGMNVCRHFTLFLYLIRVLPLQFPDGCIFETNLHTQNVTLPCF